MTMTDEYDGDKNYVGVKWNSVITNSVVNEHLIITNKILSQIGFLVHKLTRL
jgi:hypothetical protein